MAIILLNGPARSGKDTAAKFIRRHYAATEVKMSGPLKRAIPQIYSIPPNKLKELEEGKDEPNQWMFGKTYREAQIALSEMMLKPFHDNPAVFGYLMLGHLETLIGPDFVISDSGFQREIEPLVQVYGEQNVYLLRINRPNHTFEGDSREYIEPIGNMPFATINNQFDLEMYEEQIKHQMKKWGF